MCIIIDVKLVMELQIPQLNHVALYEILEAISQACCQVHVSLFFVLLYITCSALAKYLAFQWCGLDHTPSDVVQPQEVTFPVTFFCLSHIFLQNCGKHI
jgi:hypothetical protein